MKPQQYNFAFPSVTGPFILGQSYIQAKKFNQKISKKKTPKTMLCNPWLWKEHILVFNLFLNLILLKKLWNTYGRTCLKRPLKKKTKDGFSINAGQKYCRMLQVEHSAILSPFIKLPVVIKIFVLSNFEWWLKTGFTVHYFLISSQAWCRIPLITIDSQIG